MLLKEALAQRLISLEAVCSHSADFSNEQEEVNQFFSGELIFLQIVIKISDDSHVDLLDKIVPVLESIKIEKIIPGNLLKAFSMSMKMKSVESFSQLSSTASLLNGHNGTMNSNLPRASISYRDHNMVVHSIPVTIPDFVEDEMCEEISSLKRLKLVLGIYENMKTSIEVDELLGKCSSFGSNNLKVILDSASLHKESLKLISVIEKNIEVVNPLVAMVEIVPVEGHKPLLGIEVSLSEHLKDTLEISGLNLQVNDVLPFAEKELNPVWLPKFPIQMGIGNILSISFHVPDLQNGYLNLPLNLNIEGCYSRRQLNFTMEIPFSSNEKYKNSNKLILTLDSSSSIGFGEFVAKFTAVNKTGQDYDIDVEFPVSGQSTLIPLTPSVAVGALPAGSSISFCGKFMPIRSGSHLINSIRIVDRNGNELEISEFPRIFVNKNHA